MSVEERVEVLNLHNTYRSVVTPSASNMLQMTYNTTLENLAQKWVDTCKWNRPHSIDKEYSGLGQNLNAQSGTKISIQTVMQSWYFQKSEYNYEQNSCSSKCDYYKQVVWASSHELGCAYKKCDQIAVDQVAYDSAFFVVCLYSPAGNLTEARPYINGTTCTKCPPGYESCVNGLCAAQSSDGTSANAPPDSTPSTQTKPPSIPTTTSSTSIPATTSSTSIQTTTSSTTLISFSGGLVMMTLLIGNTFN
nr:hypothetical protein HmN_000895800 [Hymenolepis microstoma]